MKEAEEKRKEYLKNYKVNYDKRKKRIEVYFDIQDYKAIEKIAGEHGIKPASFLRESALAQTKGLLLMPKEIEEEKKTAVRSLRGIANNINQIAKFSNEQGFTSQEMINSLLAYLKNLEAIIKAFELPIDDKRG